MTTTIKYCPKCKGNTYHNGNTCLECRESNRSIARLIVVAIMIITLILIATSCSTSKYVEKAYIANSVEPVINGTHYVFVNLTGTYGREFILNDTAQCQPGDTIVIKDYAYNLFKEKKVVFIKYQK